MNQFIALSIVLAMLLVLQFVAPLSAQQLVLKTYDRSSGLPSDYVMNIFQDRDGFIWFATDRGASRYDGNSFTTLTTQDGLGDNFIQFITQDFDGYLWFSMYDHGVARYDGTTFRSFTKNDALPGNTIKWITHDKFGRMYFRSDDGISILHKGRFTTRQMLTSMTKVLQLNDDQIIFSLDKKLFRIIPTNDNELHYKQLTPDIPNAIVFIGSFDQDSHTWQGGRLYIGTYGGVSILRFLNDTTLAPIATYAVEGNITSIVHEGDSALWCGTLSHGISKVTPRAVTHYGANEGLLQQRVESLIRDYEGNLWISTFGSGAQKLSAPSVEVYKDRDGLPNNYVSSLYKDRSGRMWLGTSAGLAILENNSVQRLAIHEKALKEIRSIVQDEHSNYYIGTFEYLFGPCSYPQLTSNAKLEKIRIGYGVSGIYPERDSLIGQKKLHSVWLGSYGGGITHYQGANLINYPAGNGICSNVIEDIIPGKNFAWFISRNGGATRITNGRFDLFTISRGLPSNSVFSVYEDSSERGRRIWIGTDQGLTLLEKEYIKTFTEQDGIHGAPVLGIFPLMEQVNETGLLILTPIALHRLSGMKIELMSTLSFTRQGNVSINDISYSAQDSVLWLATPQGAYRIPLASLQKSIAAPKAAISSVFLNMALLYSHVSVNNQRQSLPISLRHDQNNLAIEYAGLSFINESDVRFQFKLEPLDHDWSMPTNESSVQFRNLDEGTYRFLVVAINGDNLRSIEPAMFSFRILPPFWKQWWFLTIAGMFSFLIIIAGIRYFVRLKLRKQKQEFERQQELQLERDRISRDLHDNVGAQLVNIISGLELAGRYSNSRQAEISTLLSSLKDDTRVTMSLLRETIWALQSSEMTVERFSNELEQYIRKLLKYHPGITLKFSVEGNRSAELRPVEAINLVRIAQEALTNCLKHASPTTIEVHLAATGWHTLHLQFSNDGCMHAQEEDNSGGKGIPNMERRANELGGTFQFIQHDHHRASVEISIPLKNVR